MKACMSCSLHVNVCLSDGDDDDLSLDEEDVVFDFCRVKRMANFYLLQLSRGPAWFFTLWLQTEVINSAKSAEKFCITYFTQTKERSPLFENVHVLRLPHRPPTQ